MRSLARLLPHIVPTIRSLPHAMLRAKFQWSVAQMERRGIPLDGAMLARIRHHWRGMQSSLVRELDRPFGCYEFEDGQPHWRKERFADYIRRHRMAWPRLESGALDETDRTFREMAGRYPHIEPLRELRYSLSKLKLNNLSVGSDNRNRAPLWAFGTKTARCAPSNSRYIFGPAKWLRMLIAPPPGLALVHRDYCQQEVRIAAVLSRDSELLQACESGDVYLGIARQLGFLRDSMNEEEQRGGPRPVQDRCFGNSVRSWRALAGGTGRHFAVRSLRDSGTAKGAVSSFRGFRAQYARLCRAAPGGHQSVRLDHAMPVRHQPANNSQFSRPVDGSDDLADRVHSGGAARNPAHCANP